MIKQFLYLIVTWICIFTCLSLSAFSQNAKNLLSYPSPNATALGRYVEENVSLFSGATNITIPLYEVKSGSLAIPVSLSYAGSGVKPDQHPGWVGMGWALHAGGVITRIVKGAPDGLATRKVVYEYDSNPGSFVDQPIIDYLGYLFNHKKLDTHLWRDKPYVTALARGSEGSVSAYGVRRLVDTEPDEFMFNFNGYSGRFYLSEKGELIAVSNPDLKVEIGTSMTTTPIILFHENYIYGVSAEVQYENSAILGFRITTPDGVKYEFGHWGRNDIAVESSVDFFGEFYLGERTDTWHLLRIESADSKDRIDFVYEEGEPILSFSRTEGYFNQHGTKKGFWITNLLFGEIESKFSQSYSDLAGRITYPFYLKKIISKNEELHFTNSITKEKRYNYEQIVSHLWQRALGYLKSVHVSIGSVYERRWFYSARDALRPKDHFRITNYFGKAFPDRELWVFPREDLFQECEWIDFDKVQWRQLDRIDIKDKKGKIFKSVDLGYSSNNDERLRLLELCIKGKDETRIPPYRFHYEDYETNDYPESREKLPDYLTLSTDHWGFYSGEKSFYHFYYDRDAKEMFTSKVCAEYKEKRNTVPRFLYAGMLTRIFHPTGGYTKYTYEPHNYTKKVVRDVNTGVFSLQSETKTAGGLRVKAVESFDVNDKLVTRKEYSYDLGILKGDVQYYWPSYKGTIASGANYEAETFVSHSILPVSSNNTGSCVTYSKVGERVLGYGRKDFYYQNFQNHPSIGGEYNLDENFLIHIDPESFMTSAFSGKSIERGQLREVHFFKESGDIYSLMYKEKYNYSKNQLTKQQYLPSVYTRHVGILGGVGIEGTAYKVFTYPYNLTEKEIITYDLLGNAVNKKEKFGYNQDNLIVEKSESENSGWMVKRYRYPRDLYKSGRLPSSENHVFKYMGEELHMLNYPIEEVIYKNGLIVGGVLNLYDKYKINDKHPTEEVVKKSKELKFYSHDPVNDYSSVMSLEGEVDNVSYDKRYQNHMIYEKYDESGNILQATGSDGIPTTFLWSYDRTYCIAVVVGATYEEVADLLGVNLLKYIAEGHFTDEYINEQISILRNELISCEITSYTFSGPLGMTTQTSTNGLTTYYEYDQMGRLQKVRDHEGRVLKKYEYYYRNTQ